MAIAILLIVVGPGCGAARPPAPAINTSFANIDALVCGTQPTTYDAHGRAHTPKEWYSLTALNAKLKYFPEFRAAAGGIETATDCTEARQVATAYMSFSKEHPGFDANQPYVRSSRRRPSEPKTAPRPPEEVAKLLNATIGGQSPVVAFDTTTSDCTGSFIAKNWILTAAHCLVLKDGMQDTAVDAYDGFDYSYPIFDVGLSGYLGTSAPRSSIQSTSSTSARVMLGTYPRAPFRLRMTLASCTSHGIRTTFSRRVRTGPLRKQDRGCAWPRAAICRRT